MKTLNMLTAAIAAIGLSGGAQAQSAFWSYDQQTQYHSYQACEQARTTQTLGGATFGGFLGAGLGALAGGDDTRNSLVGAAAGALLGGASGRNQVQCQRSAYAGYTTHAPDHDAYTTHAPTRNYNTPAPVFAPPPPRPAATGHSVHSAPVYAPVHTPPTVRTYSVHSAPVTTHRTYTYTQAPTYYGSTQPHAGYEHKPRAYYPASAAPRAYQPVATQTHWTRGDGAVYASPQACQAAKRQRRAVGGGFGALAGASLGALAGGDDRRNAAIGAVTGAVVGASAGHNSIQCYPIQYTPQAAQYHPHPSLYK